MKLNLISNPLPWNKKGQEEVKWKSNKIFSKFEIDLIFQSYTLKLKKGKKKKSQAGTHSGQNSRGWSL